VNGIVLSTLNSNAIEYFGIVATPPTTKFTAKHHQVVVLDNYEINKVSVHCLQLVLAKRGCCVRSSVAGTFELPAQCNS
jgi:hypothetical protein